MSVLCPAPVSPERRRTGGRFPFLRGRDQQGQVAGAGGGPAFAASAVGTATAASGGE